MLQIAWNVIIFLIIIFVFIQQHLHPRCNSIVVNRLISQAISLDTSVIGAVLAGYKLHIRPLAGMITAYNIPAFTYIYADEDLMDQVFCFIS